MGIAGSKNRCTFAAVIEKQTVANIDRDVAQLASAPRSGRGGRKFESSHPDYRKAKYLLNRCLAFRLFSRFWLAVIPYPFYFSILPLFINHHVVEISLPI